MFQKCRAKHKRDIPIFPLVTNSSQLHPAQQSAFYSNKLPIFHASGKDNSPGILASMTLHLKNPVLALKRPGPMRFRLATHDSSSIQYNHYKLSIHLSIRLIKIECNLQISFSTLFSFSQSNNDQNNNNPHFYFQISNRTQQCYV